MTKKLGEEFIWLYGTQTYLDQLPKIRKRLNTQRSSSLALIVVTWYRKYLSKRTGSCRTKNFDSLRLYRYYNLNCARKRWGDLFSVMQR
jgi:hypothetical protein